MLEFLARTFLLLGAAFGIGAAAGRARRQRAERPGAKAGTTSPAGARSAPAATAPLAEGDPAEPGRSADREPGPTPLREVEGDQSVPTGSEVATQARRPRDARSLWSGTVSPQAPEAGTFAVEAAPDSVEPHPVPPAAAATPAFDAGGIIEKGGDAAAIEPPLPSAIEEEPRQPPALTGPRNGQPDDLTRISGVGRSMERLLFEHGIFHFAQIAAWAPLEAQWIDRLSGFKGRVRRERWIEQAKAFADEANAEEQSRPG